MRGPAAEEARAKTERDAAITAANAEKERLRLENELNAATTLRRALGDASAHRGSFSSTLKDLSPKPDSCALPQTKHCECSS